MDQNWRHLPSPARPIAAAATAAIDGAQRRDEEALTVAVDDLAALDPTQTGLVLGTLVRLLLEETHPDGIDSDAVRAVLERSVRSAAQWQPEVDPHVLVLLLAGALGVTEEGDETPPPKPDVLARHAALLAADLLGTRPAPPAVTATFTEIERAQLND